MAAPDFRTYNGESQRERSSTGQRQGDSHVTTAWVLLGQAHLKALSRGPPSDLLRWWPGHYR